MSSILGGESLILATSGVNTSSQVRYASTHHDMEVPDFTFYRRSATKDPATKSSDSADSRKAFTYLMAGATGTAAAYGATSVVNAFVNR